MIKIFIKTLIIFLTFGITSCSYKPIFSEKNYNFGIGNMSFLGEKDINKVIEKRLELIKKVNKKNKKIYNILVETEKNKKIVSKDSKGDPVKFEFIILINLKVTENEKLLVDKLIEKKNIYDNDTDKFKLKQKEQIILDNISRKISESIISTIINLNDS
tara:strand:- start:1417 stop:1893 length:477 start_codon:yes stop_codon:yes gene_type:complete